MNTAMKQRLEPLFRRIFNPEVILTDDLDASMVPEWDSLNHISLVVAIEMEFGCELTADELAEMKKVGDLVRILGEKGLIVGNEPDT